MTASSKRLWEDLLEELGSRVEQSEPCWLEAAVVCVVHFLVESLSRIWE